MIGADYLTVCPLENRYAQEWGAVWDQRRLQQQKLLRDVRLEADLKQEVVAERIGSDQSFVSRYDRGERRLDLVELEAIWAAWDMKLVDFTRRYSTSKSERRVARRWRQAARFRS